MVPTHDLGGWGARIHCRARLLSDIAKIPYLIGGYWDPLLSLEKKFHEKLNVFNDLQKK